MRRIREIFSVLLVAVLAGGTLGISPVGAAEPTIHGQWSDVIDWSFIPIHASVDGDGNVVTYGGRRNQDKLLIDVWDPSDGLGEDAHVTVAHDLGSNLFCSFAVSDPNASGTVILGGTVTESRGLPNFVARYRSGELADFPSMNNPRWYGTGTTLPDGRILMQGGIPVEGQSDNPIVTAEVYSPEDGWVDLTGTTPSGVWEGRGWSYPKSFVTPAGQVWNMAEREMFYLDPDGAGGVDRIGRFPTWLNTGEASSAVNYAPGKVLIIGFDRASIIDLNYEPPRLIEAAPMNSERYWANAVVLPDGRVLVTGGSGSPNQEIDVAYAPEIWDPATNTWTLLAESQVPRLYHSTALLMPDGRVFTGGGGAPGPTDQYNAEVFSPPYLFDADGDQAPQPSFDGSPASLEYGERFTATSDQAVDRVTMMRVGNNTHSMNTQNFLELPFAQVGNQLTIDAPSIATFATPGDYMLFALNADGVPSQAQMVHISGEGETPPPALINTAAPDVQVPWSATEDAPASSPDRLELPGPDGPTDPEEPVVPPLPDVPDVTIPDRRDDVLCGGLVATMVGTSGDDVLVGTPGQDVIAGLGGSDVINGLGGDDVLCGGSGADVIAGGLGFDIILGGKGADELHANSPDDRKDDAGAEIDGGAGADLLVGSNRVDLLYGGKGSDEVRGYGSADTLRGEAGRDLLVGGAGADNVRGGRGDDTILVSADDVVRGGAGFDVCTDSELADSSGSCEE